MTIAHNPTYKLSKWEAKSIEILNAHFPEYNFEREVKLIEGRQFRFDFVHRESRVAIEVHGATFSAGRHNRGNGMATDCEKALLAASIGYLPLSITGSMVNLPTWARIIGIIDMRMLRE